MSRNRVIYQSKALFIAPNATGVQLWATGSDTADLAKSRQESGNAVAATSTYNGTGLLYKLDRVQNCNFNFTINRQDVNEFGKLARIGTVVNEPPTVTLDYSYYITDGLNERLMGFNFGGTFSAGTLGLNKNGAPAFDTAMVSGANAMSGFLTETQGQNYYILTVDEGEDVVGATINSPTDSIIAIGNGFVTNYQFTASVGDVPTASVTVEGFNIKSDVGNGTANVGYSGSSPAIYNGSVTAPVSRITGYNKYYKINAAQLGSVAGTGAATVTALRPGDIVLSLPSPSAANEASFVNVADIGTNAINIQSFGFSVPLARTTLSRLGAMFGYNRVVNVPLNMDLTINALVNELAPNKDLFDVLCGNQTTKQFTITLNECSNNGLDPARAKIAYNFRGAILTSENHTQDIGGNETVDLTYSIQIGGSNDNANGLFMSGSYTTGTNMALESGYALPANDPSQGTDYYSGLGFTIANFYKIGSGRNY
jgi:hypothetical protein